MTWIEYLIEERSDFALNSVMPKFARNRIGTK